MMMNEGDDDIDDHDNKNEENNEAIEFGCLKNRQQCALDSRINFLLKGTTTSSICGTF